MTSNTLAKMPVRRTLQPAAKIAVGEMVKWQDRQGTEIALNVPLVRSLFKSRHPFTDSEILLFIHQAMAKRANPFVGDLYLVKYAADSPAQLVTGYHYLIQAAKNNPDYAGFETWFIDDQGKRIPDGLETIEKVIACICQVHIKGYDTPVKFVARMKEFKKSFPGTPWQGMPLVMLQKCAIGNAHRLADPGLAGMYLSEEFGQEYAAEAVIDADSTEIEQPEIPEAAAPEASQAESSPEPQAEPANEEGCAPSRGQLLTLMEKEVKRLAALTGQKVPEEKVARMAEWISTDGVDTLAKGPTELDDAQLAQFVDYLRRCEG